MHPTGTQPMPFQVNGAIWMAGRAGSINADEMGLGKTIQTIMALNLTKPERVLIVCPATLKINWQREIEKWSLPAHGAGIVYGDFWPKTPWVIINYDLLTRHVSNLKAVTWDALVLDEAHYIKTRNAQRTKIAMEISARRRYLLTGTPILNRPIELWPLLRIIGAVEPGTYWPFAKRYANARRGRFGWDIKGASNIPELAKSIRPHYLRRTKEQVLPELPAKMRQVLLLPPPEDARYGELEKAWQQIMEGGLDATIHRITATKDFDEAGSLARLRHETALWKVPFVISHVREIIEDGYKLVVFGHHRDVLEAIHTAVPHSVLLYGGMTAQQKQQAVDRFQRNSDCPLFVGQIQAAGMGITLTAASRVVFAELDWVPANMTQAEDRLHRIGQKDSIMVQHLVFDGSVEGYIAEALVKKQGVINNVIPLPQKEKGNDIRNQSLDWLE